MRLVTFRDSHGIRIGALAEDGSILDLAAAAPELPRDMLGLIAAGPPAWTAARCAFEKGGQHRLRSADAILLAPIPRPARNIFCVGKNYREHAKEFAGSGFDTSNTGGADIPSDPVVFTKAPSTVIATGEPIPAHLDPTGSVDYEGELAVVVGRSGRGIAKTEALAHIFGYTIVNDVTARELQGRHKQWFLGKSIDGFCPMGPALLTADAVPDVTALRVTTCVNGELRQEATLAALIFDIPTLIATISAGITLQPGDIIATGTPAGVGIGFKPPRYLKSGDRVAVSIPPIGTLENPVA